MSAVITVCETVQTEAVDCMVITLLKSMLAHSEVL